MTNYTLTTRIHKNTIKTILLNQQCEEDQINLVYSLSHLFLFLQEFVNENFEDIHVLYIFDVSHEEKICSEVVSKPLFAFLAGECNKQQQGIPF